MPKVAARCLSSASNALNASNCLRNEKSFVYSATRRTACESSETNLLKFLPLNPLAIRNIVFNSFFGSGNPSTLVAGGRRMGTNPLGLCAAFRMACSSNISQASVILTGTMQTIVWAGYLSLKRPHATSISAFLSLQLTLSASRCTNNASHSAIPKAAIILPSKSESLGGLRRRLKSAQNGIISSLGFTSCSVQLIIGRSAWSDDPSQSRLYRICFLFTKNQA